MADHPVTLRSISWRDFCPWLIIVRSFRLAISPQLLTVATLGVLAMMFGFLGLDLLLSSESEHADIRSSVAEIMHPPVPEIPQNIEGVWQALVNGPVYGVWHRLNAPYRCLLMKNRAIGLSGVLYCFASALWMLIVWSWFGAIIVRASVLQLTVDDRPQLSQLFRHAFKKFSAHFLAPLIVLLLVVALTMVLMLLAGLFAQWDASLWIAGLLWGPALIFAFGIAILLLGLWLGWPLIWTTIGTEGGDSFDALSRAYSYTSQRPLHYLFYTLVATVVGTLGWFFVYYVSDSVIHLTYWGAAWITGWERITVITENTDKLETAGRLGVWMIDCWVGLVRTVVTAFTCSYFWASMTTVYLLLRSDVDRMEMDEVHLDPQDATYGLPPLVIDETGVPSVADEVPVAGSDND